MHHTSSRTSSMGTFSCSRLCISKHIFCICISIYWTPYPWSYIQVSCNLIAISNASAWVEILCCDSIVLRCGIKDATNHAWCCASVSVMLASWIILFSISSRSQGVSLGSITISLNLMIDCISNFCWLNSFFSASQISAILALGWLLECLIYQINAQFFSALTKVAFLILLSVTSCASHTTLTMDQNCSGSSLPTPLNIGNLIAFSMLNFFFAHKCAKATYELVPLLIQSIFNFHRVPNFQHQTSLRQILVLIMEPFVALLGPDPGSKELLAKQIPQLPTVSATVCRAQTKSHPR